MAVTATQLTEGTDTDGGSTATTASISPGSNRLILLVVKSRTGISAVPNVPTVTGNGITWTEITHLDPDNAGTSRVRFTVFRGHHASPSAGTIALDFAGQAQTHVSWTVDELDGVDVATNNGVVQSATNIIDSAGPAGTSLTATLAAFGSASNATWGVCGSNNSTVAYAEGSGFAEVSFQQEAAGVIDTEFRNDNDTTVDFTFDSHVSVGVIGLEIKATVASASVNNAVFFGAAF